MSEDEDETTVEGAARVAKKEMSPEEALALIREGKPVTNAKIRKLRLRGTFDKLVKFQNCTLSQLQIDTATFQDAVVIIKCQVDKLHCQRKSTMEKGFDLNASTFNHCVFSQITVRGPVNAGLAQFQGKTTFSACHFGAEVSFWDTRFYGWTDFKNCDFTNDADFRSMDCSQGLVYTKCHFHQAFLFRGTNVEKKLEFKNCEFDNLLDISKAKLHDFSYFEEIQQGPEFRFACLNAVAERILIRPEQIEGKLVSEQKGDHANAMLEYGLLKRCYQSLHRFDYEDWAFYRFKVNQRLSIKATWKKPFTKLGKLFDWLFLDVGCGYGTNPKRAVRMALTIIVFFALVYALGVETFYIEKPPFEGEPTTLPNRIMIGLITSVSVFTSGMGEIREMAKGWMNVFIMMESIMGILLFGLFIVAFSRKVIR